MKFQDFIQNNALFHVETLSSGIHLIRDVVGVEMYLIEGERQAVLLDAGIGIGNVKEVVDGLTDKPVEVYLTHGHVDHAGGIYNYKEAWVPKEDLGLLEKQSKAEFRLDFASAYLPVLKEIDDIQGYMPYYSGIQLNTIQPGESIELGNRRIQVVDFMGHTKGSVGFYDEKTKTLFAGDGCNNSTFLFLGESATVAEYKSTLVKLKEEWMPKVEYFVICHEYVELPVTVVDDLIECCDAVLQGRASGIPFIIPYEPFQNGHSYWAIKGENHREKEDGKIGNMIYDDRKIL